MVNINKIFPRKKPSISTVFFRIKPVMLLIEIKNSEKTEPYASQLGKKLDCTYSHVIKLLHKMEKSNLVQFKKNGRVNIVKLTKKGEELAKLFNDSLIKLEN